MNTRERQLGMISTCMIHKDVEFENIENILEKENCYLIKNLLPQKRNLPRNKRVREIFLNLSTIKLKEKEKILKEIDPTHIYEVIKKEKPLVIGLILKSIEKNISKNILEKIGSKKRIEILSSVRGIKPTPFFSNFIKVFLIKKLGIVDIPVLSNLSKYEIIVLMNWKEINILIEELGMREITLACKNIEEKFISTLLNKFPSQSRGKILKKMKNIQNIPENRSIKARQEILEVTNNYYNKGKLIETVGIYKLGKIFFKESHNILKILYLKINFELSSTFMKIVKDLKRENALLDVREIKEIESNVKYLSEIEKIGGDWKFYF